MNNNFISGLKKTKFDKRNYSFHKTFKKKLRGITPLVLPDEYLLVSSILNQGQTPSCTAYAASAIAESQYGKPFDPEWFYAQEAEVNGYFDPVGYDIQIPMKTGVKKGFKPLNEGNPEDYKENDYYQITGPYDLFDSIRAAMWYAKDTHRTVNLGTEWYREWEATVAPLTYKNLAGGHDIKCAGWTYRDSKGNLLSPDKKIFLAIQNSYGKDEGDNGIHYFPREIVNKEFAQFGAFMWLPHLAEGEVRRVSAIKDIIIKLIGLYNQLIYVLKSRNN